MTACSIVGMLVELENTFTFQSRSVKIIFFIEIIYFLTSEFSNLGSAYL